MKSVKNLECDQEISKTQPGYLLAVYPWTDYIEYKPQFPTL